MPALFVNTDYIVSVMGPIPIKLPKGPGEVQEYYDVAVAVIDNTTHKVHCPTYDIAKAICNLATTTNEDIILDMQKELDALDWPKEDKK